MITKEILPQTLYIDKIKENKILSDFYLDKFYENFYKIPILSRDWDIHTDFHEPHLQEDFASLKIQEIDYCLAKSIYIKYIEKFLSLSFPEIDMDSVKIEDIWYNVYGKGQEAKLHDHSGASFSLVHYLKYEKSEHQAIEFVDKLNVKRFSPEIEEGDIIMFPSNMRHRVEPSKSNKLRVSLAMNVSIYGHDLLSEDTNEGKTTKEITSSENA